MGAKKGIPRGRPRRNPQRQISPARPRGGRPERRRRVRQPAGLLENRRYPAVRHARRSGRGGTRGHPAEQRAPAAAREKIVVDGQAEPNAAEVTLPPGTRSLSIDYAARASSSRAAWSSATAWSATTTAGWRPRTAARPTTPTSSPATISSRSPPPTRTGSGTRARDAGLAQEPWFYETWWFYGLVALGVAGLGAGTSSAGARTRCGARTSGWSCGSASARGSSRGPRRPPRRRRKREEQCSSPT